MFNTTGEQIKYFREKHGLSRPQFSKKYGISPNTLKYIESGQLEITETRKIFFRNIFENLGCEFKDTHTSTKNDNIFDKIKQHDINIKHEIDFFKEKNSDYILYTISNDTMYPMFCRGDIVGGIKIYDKELFSKFNGYICIISDSEKEKFIGRVIKVKKNTINIVSYNHLDAKKVPFLEIKNVTSISQVSRHWCINNLLNSEFSAENQIYLS